MLVSVEDVTDYMALSFEEGSASATAASAIVQGIEGDLRTYLRRPLEETTVTDEVVKIDSQGRVRLALDPLREVTAFSVDGTPVEVTSYEVKPTGITVRWPFFASPLIAPSPVILVSYIAGLTGEDPNSDFGRAARSAIKRVSARDVAQVVLEKAPGVARLNVEGTAIDFTGGVKAGKGGWFEEELKGLSRFRRKVYRA